MSKENEQASWPCYCAITENYIETGFDSNVYRYGDFVIKAYKNGSVETPYFANEARNFLYSHIMNLGSQFALKNDLTVKFPFSKNEVSLRVNPVVDVRKCVKCGLIESLSPFIPGKNLNMNPYEYDIKELSVVLTKVGYVFEENLGVRGIKIIPSNTKEFPEKGTITVTDLCASVIDLRKV